MSLDVPVTHAAAAGGKPVIERGSSVDTFADAFILDLCGIETTTTLTQHFVVQTFPDGSQQVPVTRTFVRKIRAFPPTRVPEPRSMTPGRPDGRRHADSPDRVARHLKLRDDVDGVAAAHDGRVRPVEGFLHGRGQRRCWHPPHPGDPWVTGAGFLGARGQQPHELPIGVGPEHHSLLRVVQGKAAVKQLGAFVTRVQG
jgi:hypothetical protein